MGNIRSEIMQYWKKAAGWLMPAELMLMLGLTLKGALRGLALHALYFTPLALVTIFIGVVLQKTSFFDTFWTVSFGGAYSPVLVVAEVIRMFSIAGLILSVRASLERKETSYYRKYFAHMLIVILLCLALPGMGEFSGFLFRQLGVFDPATGNALPRVFLTAILLLDGFLGMLVRLTFIFSTFLFCDSDLNLRSLGAALVNGFLMLFLTLPYFLVWSAFSALCAAGVAMGWNALFFSDAGPFFHFVLYVAKYYSGMVVGAVFLSGCAVIYGRTKLSKNIFIK